MTEQNHNLYFHFQKLFSLHADKVLLTCATGATYRYADVARESARLARFLNDLGIKRGDRVTVQVHKSPQALCLYLACIRAGFVYHPLNTGYQKKELTYFLEDAGPALIVCYSANLEAMRRVARPAGIEHLYTLDADGGGTLIEQSRCLPAEFADAVHGKNDLAALLYSSGTTGTPKGIMLTHGNLLSNALALVQAWEFSDADVLLHALPIYHVHGLFVATHCILLSGASMHWLPGFDTKQVIDRLPECTVMMGVPTYYNRLLGDTNFCRETAKNMRLFISGSAPLLEETFHAFATRTGQRILERYGMTETGMNTSNPLHGERRAGTVGLPLPGVQLRVCDDKGTPLPRNEVGNLQVRGENVFMGYWKLPAKSAEDFTADGYFNTGDKGRIDDDGYVSIVGRAKDMVITGGLNVYPKEIELVIDALPGVRESAVIGVPHHDFGEALVAVIVAEQGVLPGERDILSQIRNELAAFKVPKRVVLTAELPRNSMGKVQKNTLRERYHTLLQSN